MIRMLALALAVLAVVSLFIGDGTLAAPHALILVQVRLPRSLLGILVDAGLGLSGAVLQGALRNPLADPGLLGITGTAGLGAVIAFYWGLSQHFAPALPVAGLLGAGVGAGFLLAFAGRAPSGPSLILAGVAVSAIAAALLALALTLAPNTFALTEITFWLMGGLADRPLWQIALAAMPILLGCTVLLGLGSGIDALSLGEDTALSLGVPVTRTLRLAAAGTALAVGAGSAIAGRSASWALSYRTCYARFWASDPVPFCRPQHSPVQPCCDVTVTAEAGEFAALCGPNGAGKSTLLRALAGLLPGTTPRDPRRVAWLPQGARCAWGLTVEQVATLCRIPHHDRADGPVTSAMVLCGILHLRTARVDRISGGEARRAMLARVFATEPDVFLLDEPTADLDPSASHAIMPLLRATAGAGRTVVVVLRALDLALRYAHRVVVLEAGHLTADLPAGEALPAAAAAFGLRFGVDPEPRLLPP
jgi:ABC-type cobalamin/Fe3+-siderophores transport system ATPase subunit/ABC-type cobalamin transport system permease subunit